MSFDTTYKLWVTTKKDIKTLLKKQEVLKKIETVDEKALQFQLFSEMYILYAELVNKLSSVYLHTLQVQKRDIVRNLLDSALNRYAEIKATLKDIELSEYVYMDKTLIKRKLTPENVMIWRSPNFLYRRPPDLANIHYGNRIFMTEEQKAEFAEQDRLKVQEACTLIQAHERARKARIYQNIIKNDPSKLKVKNRLIDYHFTFNEDTTMSVPVKKTIYSDDYIKNNPECIEEFRNVEVKIEEVQEDPEVVRVRQEKAAIIIQRCWRNHKQRRILRWERREQEYILGIKLKKKLRNPKIYEEEVMQMYRLEKKKEQLDEEYRQLIEDERTRIFQERAPWIMEDISDHIRAWFQEFYENAGALQPYPPAVKGGTVLVLKDETMDLQEFRQYVNDASKSKEQRKKKLEKEKAQKQKEKEKAKKEKQKLKKKLKDYKKKGIIPLAHELTTNKNILKMQDTIKQYSIDWRFVDEYLNRYHEPIKDWVTEDELAKLHQELRLVVDEYMRQEWELLQKAWCMDNGKKYKPSKKKKPKKKGKGKKKRKKEPKDLTPDMTMEALYNELKSRSLIHKPQHKSFHDYIAEFNFLADSTRDQDNLTTMGPSVGDIKILIEECIIGMGEISVPRPKSLLIMGPYLSGKRLLCNIIASEIDALVIDLSPEKTFFLKEDDLEFFLHVVMKVAKAFEPTLLYIEEAHRVFWKKVPEEMEDLKPRILAKTLKSKILSKIKKDDRIMLLGTSEMPWSAKGKFKRLFQKVVLIPRTDYGTAFLMWLNLLEQNIPEHVEDYQISALTKCLTKYTTGDVDENVRDTLTPERKLLMSLKKFKPTEFLDTLIEKPEPHFPLAEKILKKYEKWYRKSNKMAKKRARFLRAKMKKGKKR